MNQDLHYDLSAAFDTIDREILLERLRFRYAWFLQPSSSVVHFLSCWPSSTHSVGQVFFPVSSCGVPRGSVLGPVLFSLDISPLEYAIMALALNAIVYADGSQLSSIMRQSRRATALQDLTLCNQGVFFFFSLCFTFFFFACKALNETRMS